VNQHERQDVEVGGGRWRLGRLTFTALHRPSPPFVTFG